MAAMRILDGKQLATVNTEVTWYRQHSNPSMEAGCIRVSPFVKKMRSQRAEETRMCCGTQRIATKNVQEKSHSISSEGSPALQVSAVLPSITPTNKTKLFARQLTSLADTLMVQATMVTGRLRLVTITGSCLMSPRWLKAKQAVWKTLGMRISGIMARSLLPPLHQW